MGTEITGARSASVPVTAGHDVACHDVACHDAATDAPASGGEA